MEASQHEIARACVKQVLLGVTVPEDSVKGEAFASDQELGSGVVISLVDGKPLVAFGQLSADEWPDPHCDRH